MAHFWQELQDVEARMRDMEDRMQVDIAHMQRLMDQRRDLDTLHEFFYLTRLGAGPHTGARQRLLPMGGLDEQRREVESSFRSAVREGNTRKVALLVDHLLVVGDVDREYTYGGHETNPLIDACSRGHLEVARLLIERGGADVNKRVGRQTPLYVAAKEGHTAIVKLLLKNGAELQPRTSTRRDSAVAELPGGSLFRDTPLHAAIRQHHHDVVTALLGSGASFLSPDYAGDTARDLLRRWAQQPL